MGKERLLQWLVQGARRERAAETAKMKSDRQAQIQAPLGSASWVISVGLIDHGSEITARYREYVHTA